MFYTNTKTKKLKDVLKEVEGWLTEREGTFLYNTAKNFVRKGVIVEIGSWKGRSTICLALGIKDSENARIYAIDTHKGDESCGFKNTLLIFKRNLKRFGVFDKVVPIVMASKKAAQLWSGKNKSIGLLWIDASHKYEDIKNDFIMWEEYLSDGGIVALHDTFFKGGPKRVVDEFVFKGNFTNIGFVDEITYATKVQQINKLQKLNNKYKKIVRDLILARRKYNFKRIMEHIQKTI